MSSPHATPHESIAALIAEARRLSVLDDDDAQRYAKSHAYARRYRASLANRNALIETVEALHRECLRLEDAARSISETDAFFETARAEARHERMREEPGAPPRKDADWFWLIGYLAGRVLSPVGVETKCARVAAVAAACLNWHAAIVEKSAAWAHAMAEPATGERSA